MTHDPTAGSDFIDLCEYILVPQLDVFQQERTLMPQNIEILDSTDTQSTRLVPAAPGSEPHFFDLEHYRSRLAKLLDNGNEENQVFFRAIEFADELHKGQRRRSGAPYISHPCAVAEILARELRFRDPHLLAAALLHDVVEDVPAISLDDIEHQFGEVVAELVDGCTKLTRHYLDRATLKDLTHSKIFLSASRRLGVLVIKLADRLHNLRTLHHLPKAKRQRIAQETIEVYAPIAAKFNIFPLKRELYHLALSYLYPRKSKKILQFIHSFRNSSEFQGLLQALQKALADASFPAALRTRAKGLGSYYDPIKRTLELTNTENYVDFGIILQSEDPVGCYTALGIVNTTFPPIPRSLRDFIANPKNTGYRSLHVRIHFGGHNYLIKIRTPTMDEWATYGILTEWNTQKPLSDEHWQEISELLRTIGEYSGAGPQRKALIRLSEAEEIFVYSPKGDIYYLPKGSIVLDFAYKIHSELGDFCSGATINNAWVPLTHVLKDGDTVEILTSSEPLEVDPELETLCKTPRSRSAINKKLHQKRQRYAQKVGEEILMQEIHRHGLPKEILVGENIYFVLEFLNLKDLSELFVRVGQDLLSPHLILYYLKPSPQGLEPTAHRGSLKSLPLERNSLPVFELDRAIHKFARCCNPYPGQDDLVAILSERGTTFHHKDCKDLLQRHDLQPQQLLDVKWNKAAVWRFPLSFHVVVSLETLHSLIPALARAPSNIMIQDLGSYMDKHDQPMVRLTVRLNDFSEAQRFFSCLPKHRSSIEDYGREEGPRRLP
jgi:GTP diphosphokinase / guanosine-3',5'-bis(diphosphate) 3'-diphosphatase